MLLWFRRGLGTCRVDVDEVDLATPEGVRLLAVVREGMAVSGFRECGWPRYRVIRTVTRLLVVLGLLRRDHVVQTWEVEIPVARPDETIGEGMR